MLFRSSTWEQISPPQCGKKVKVKSLSRVPLFATLWTVAYQAPPSMGFSRQEYWSGLPCSPPGDLPNPGIEPGFPALQADSLPQSHQESPVKTVYVLFVSPGINLEIHMTKQLRFLNLYSNFIISRRIVLSPYLIVPLCFPAPDTLDLYILISFFQSSYL